MSHSSRGAASPARRRGWPDRLAPRTPGRRRSARKPGACEPERRWSPGEVRFPARCTGPGWRTARFRVRVTPRNTCRVSCAQRRRTRAVGCQRRCRCWRPPPCGHVSARPCTSGFKRPGWIVRRRCVSRASPTGRWCFASSGCAWCVRTIWTGDHLDAVRRQQQTLVDPALRSQDELPGQMGELPFTSNV